MNAVPIPEPIETLVSKPELDAGSPEEAVDLPYWAYTLAGVTTIVVVSFLVLLGIGFVIG